MVTSGGATAAEELLVLVLKAFLCGGRGPVWRCLNSVKLLASGPDIDQFLPGASLFWLLHSYFAIERGRGMHVNPRSSKQAKQMNESDWSALRSDVTEAFSPGSPVQERDLFSGRATEIGLLEDAVAQRGRHAIVFGERGVGKTSLANVLPLILQRPNRQLIYVRVNSTPSDSFVSLWKNVFKRLTYEAATENGPVIRKISDDFTSELTPDDVQLVLQEFGENQMPIIGRCPAIC